MHFALSDDQVMFQETARRFFADAGGTAVARRVMAGDREAAVRLWRQMGELGFMAIAVPTAYGGAGEGTLSLVPVLEEAGRVLAPGPLPETVGFAVPLLVRAGTPQQRERYLPGIASGQAAWTLALDEPGREAFAGEVGLSAVATGDGWRLTGEKHLVVHAEMATRLVVLARTHPGADGEGTALFLVDPRADGVTLAEERALDQTRPLWHVRFDGVAVADADRLGPDGAGWALVRTGYETLAAAVVAASVGGMERCVELSAEHAKTRVQFGQPIGRFQAIKHRIVDMQVDLESARSLSYYAAWALDEDAPDRAVAVSNAKAFVSEAYVRVAQANVQTHGGMGFTWDADPHLYVKRAKAWAPYAGSVGDHLERVAAAEGW
ncbi:MAG: acyl-CoA dehydrogenase family protein [Actinomycetia bacterium]|nr:acyl-CoA dehydrogenase family protein [Actinomycetes bacterium]